MTYEATSVEVLRAFEIYRHPHQEFFAVAGSILFPCCMDECEQYKEKHDALAFYIVGFESTEGYPSYCHCVPLDKKDDRDCIREAVKTACDKHAEYCKPLTFLRPGSWSREGKQAATA